MEVVPKGNVSIESSLFKTLVYEKKKKPNSCKLMILDKQSKCICFDLLKDKLNTGS